MKEKTDDDTTNDQDTACSAPVAGMITKLRIDIASAVPQFGMACQRLIPWADGQQEFPVGAMACFLGPGRSTDPDCHDQDEVMLILSGSGVVAVAGERCDVDTGDVVPLPRNHEHVVHNHSTEPLSWVSVYWPLYELGPESPA
jgi:mannose-6-phosphate isomerase-like protein (cupin superfamily)